MRNMFNGRMVLVLMLFVATVLAMTTSVIAQAPEHVPWSADQPITWQLFLSPYPQDGCLQAEAAAIHMTLNWSVSYVIDYDTLKGTWYGYVDKPLITVTNTMEPLLSWAATQGKSADVLNHEQRHFDLNEVYARKLAARLAAPHVTGATIDAVRTALKKEINTTASAVLDMASQMQSLYDEETAHSTNGNMQASWAAKIAAWLASPTQAP